MRRCKQICVHALAGILMAGGLVACSSGHWSFKKKYFPTIARLAVKRPVKLGETRVFRLDDVSSPQFMRLLTKEEQQGPKMAEGFVWIHRMEDGRIKMVIETRDRGEKGHYGFAYTPRPIQPVKSSDGRYTLDVPGPLVFTEPDYQIDKNWWKVYKR